MGTLFGFDSPLWRITDKILKLLWISILWVICCIPILTIGASTSALYSITLKYVKNEESYFTSSFFSAFQSNLKQGIQIWLLSFVLGLTLFVGLIFYFRFDKPGLFSFIMTTAYLGIFVAYILTNIFVYPLLAKFENSSLRTIKNAMTIALTHLPSAISMLIISILIILIGAFIFPPLLIAAPALIAYINSLFFVKIFEPYISGINTSSEAIL